MPQLATLLAEAQAEADAQHRRRLAELKELAPLLAHFEPLRAALQQQGLAVFPSQVTLAWRYTDASRGGQRRRVKHLRLYTSMVGGNSRAQFVLQTLLQLGCREVRRDMHTITLKLGALLVDVDTVEQPEQRAQRASDYAVRTSAAAGPVALQHLAAVASAQSRQVLAGAAA